MRSRAIRRAVLSASRNLGLEEHLRVAHALVGPRATRCNRLDDARLYRLIRQLPRDANVVDVGANRGTILEWSVRCAPCGRHLAFEPLADAAAELRRRFPSVRVVEAAVSDTAGTASFWRAQVDTRSSLRCVDNSVEILVRTVRLDDEIEVPPSLIKIDVEGAEALVLAGALNTLRRHRPMVVFEHGRASRELFGIQSGRVFDLLTGVGMRIFDLSGRGPYSLREFANATVWNFVARPTDMSASS